MVRRRPFQKFEGENLEAERRRARESFAGQTVEVEEG